METAWVAIGIFGVLWIAGWVACLRETENTSKTIIGKFIGAVALFFLWPYVAWAMTKQMG